MISNSIIKIFLLCPVPEDQKPINEYLKLKDTSIQKFFLSWTFISPKNFKKQIFFFFCFLFVLIFSRNSDFIFQTIILIFSLFFLILSRWILLKNKFQESRLFYEEASWYDGHTWEKPLLLIKNDKLICIQKLQPIIQNFLKILFPLFFLFIFFLFF